MKKFQKKPFHRPFKSGEETKPLSEKLRTFSGKNVPASSENMPAPFREMWDVFLSFTRLNY